MLWFCWRPAPLGKRYALRHMTTWESFAWILAYILGFCCYTVEGNLIRTKGRACRVKVERREDGTLHGHICINKR